MKSYGPPHMAKQKQDDPLEHTYSYSVGTCQKREQKGGVVREGQGYLCWRYDMMTMIYILWMKECTQTLAEQNDIPKFINKDWFWTSSGCLYFRTIYVDDWMCMNARMMALPGNDGCFLKLKKHTVFIGSIVFYCIFLFEDMLTQIYKSEMSRSFKF